MFVAINHYCDEYRICDDFETLWRSVMLDRRADRHFGLPRSFWEIGRGQQLPGRLPEIVGAPIATFVSGYVDTVIIYQNQVTKLYHM